MGILERLALPARHRDQSLSINDWADYFTFGGNTYPVVQTTMGTVDREQVGFTSVAGFKGSGPIFSLVLARLQVFSQVRFQWTRFAGSQPTELFGTSELGVLERPWRGGTTSDLLARMEVHASVAGCAYVTRPRADRLSLLRPDRVIIVMGSETDAEDPSEAPDAEIIGFVHETSRGKMTFFDPDQIAYYSPIPDPDYRFLGMSWITPVIRDLQADSLATEHKARYFCNAATPNLAIKFDASIAIEKVRQFKELFESEHKGALNAWKTVFLGGGADPVTVGNSFKEMDYAVIQGRAESRLASAAGVPPSWVGFAEGLSGSSLNAGNFNSARRRFSDGTMIHLWGSAATSLEVLLNRPQGATLWYDPRVPFMREDAGDLAAIQQNQAQTIVALVRDGFTPESAVAAVTKNDFSLLVHSGKVSVQLQEPGTNPGFGEQVPKASAPDGARSQERHTPGGNPHNQQDHAGGGTVGLAKKAVKAITPGFKLPQGIPQKDYDRLVRIRTYGYDSTEADESWADSLDWPAWVKERAEGEASLLTKEQWYRESLPGELKDMPIGQLRERMAEHLHKTWAGKPIAVRAFPEDLEAILKDGRFKTQFETGKAGREASFMPARRKDLEAALHGIPHDSDPSKRPVYGYVSMDPDTPWEDKQLNKFGPIAVMLKDSVRSRTTATVGDSANEDYSVWPSPVDNPSSVSANPVIVRNSIRRFPTALDDGRGRDTLHPEFRANEYVEAQIHDGVTVDDIVEVVFLVEPSDALKGQLKRAGIPWKVSTPPTSGNAVRAVILTDEWDDDPIGELDDDTLILLQAMAELDEEAGVQERAWNPALHKRWPKGHPLGGKFKPMVELLKEAIRNHDGKGHPFEHFDRPQLVKAAKARGIALKRGEDKDSIAKKLLADLAIGKAKVAPPPAAAPAKKAAKAAKKAAPKKPDFKLDEADRLRIRVLPFKGGPWFGKKESLQIRANKGLGHIQIGAVHREQDDTWTASPIGDGEQFFKAPPKKANRDQAIKALLDAHDAAQKAAAAPPAKPKAAKAGPGATQFHRNVKGIEDLQRTVEGGQIVEEKRLGGGAIGDTRTRRYKDGTKLVWKKATTKHENDAEQLAALTARALGLEAPRIYRNEEKVVNMEFKEGEVAYDTPVLNYRVDGVPDKVANTRDGRMMGLLDLLIDNSDRHNGNWLIRDDGRYIPIDHGYAFAGRPGRRLPDPRTAKKVRSGFAEHYYDMDFAGNALGWRPNALAKSDVVEIRKRLEKLRPDFDHIGRGDWHRFMMERLDEIGKHANGTQPRVLPPLV